MYKYIKRILDVLFSLVLLIILLIPMVIVMILILIIDRQKPLFTQTRTGKNGKEFRLYKLRSMKIINGTNDYTKLGKVIRKLSFDELPQLINILKGDMSFIGPRPWITDYYKYMTDYQKKRFNVLPGLTGLAQVNGRNGISIIDKINYDIQYIDNFSFKQDIYIVFKTIYVVLKNDNADLDEKGIKSEIEVLKNQ